MNAFDRISLTIFSLRNVMWTFSLFISMILWFRGIQLVTNLLTCCTHNFNTFLIKMIVPYWPFNSYVCHKYGICYILSHKTLSKNDFIYTPLPNPPSHNFLCGWNTFILDITRGLGIGLYCGHFHLQRHCSPTRINLWVVSSS